MLSLSAGIKNRFGKIALLLLALLALSRLLFLLWHVQAVAYPDSVSYQQVRDLLMSGQWSDTVGSFRGQSFPMAWMLSEILGVNYPVISLLLNFVLTILGVAILWTVDGKMGFWFGFAAAYLFLMHASIDFMTTYLTESILFGVLVLNFALILAFQYRSTYRWSVLAPAIVVSTCILNSLKTWLVIFPGIYFACQILLSLFVLRSDRKTILSAIVMFLAVLLVPKVFYRPALGNTPAILNMGIFMKSYRSDLFVEKQLERSTLSEKRRQDLLGAAVKTTECFNDSHYACMSQGADSVQSVFRTVYLSDTVGVFEIARISWIRLVKNIAGAESNSANYGPVSELGHSWMPKGLLGRTALALYFAALMLIAWSLLRWKAFEYGGMLCLGIATLVTFLFLSVGSGGAETARVELPGYILFYLVLTTMLVKLFRWRSILVTKVERSK